MKSTTHSDRPANDDTMPIRAIRAIGPIRAALIIFGFLLAVVVVSAGLGYRSGVAKHTAIQATQGAAEAARQFNLGLEDLAAGRPLIAAERFRYVLNLDPNYPGAAEKLVEAESRLAEVQATPTVDPTTGPEELRRQAEIAIASEEWDKAISILTRLSALHPDHEPETVKALQLTAYQSRGVALIKAKRLQEGIFDVDKAETYGTISEEAAAYRIWATQYIRGSALWGADWPTTIAIFSDLYLAAPYFHDTLYKLQSAHEMYGDQLAAAGDPCGAAFQFAEANDVLGEAEVRAKQSAAEEACAQITPTPEASPTPEESPTPSGTDTPGIETPTATAGP